MARLVGVDLPRDKRIEVALTYIYGIGRTRSQQLLAATGVDPSVRVDTGGSEQLLGAGTADAVDVGESDLDALVAREVNTNEACHVAVPCLFSQWFLVVSRPIPPRVGSGQCSGGDFSQGSPT